MKPEPLFDRDPEWADLCAFASSTTPGLGIGVVYGRRRQGKSFLLRRLCETTGGLYMMALEQGRTPALQRFADTLANHISLPEGSLRFASWEQALRTTFDALIRTEAASPALLVLDELPYLIAHSPELPSILQNLYDELNNSPAERPLRVMVCGSALSIMTELLSGTKALRGRAVLDLCFRSFDYRQTATFWGITDPKLAFRVHAVLGGTPGYRDLIEIPLPQRVADFGRWLAGHVLNPSHALFTEADYLLREDPRVTDRALYHSILAAISNGATTASKIGAALGRADRSLAHPLTVLRTAGFVHRIEDVMRQRRTVLTIADPIVRFHQLVTTPRLAAFEERRAQQAWEASKATFSAQILGPHFEYLARTWTATFASSEVLDEPIGPVGPTVVNDPSGKTQHELDVVALADGETTRTENARVALLGEAKSADQPRTVRDLRRLEHIRALLIARGVHAADARIALFAHSGFGNDLVREATQRRDVLLNDLAQLYGNAQ